ncbi:MAG: taurine dioxygenase [Rhodospirillaceae bacterium]|nr:taurine dioxygenase [Rhodospirillaceae bacterium]
MTLSLRQMTPSLGAEITGVDVANLDNQEFDAIYDSFNQHSVVVIRDQNITPEQHADFSRRFGKLMVHVLKDDLLEGQPEIYRLSNKIENGVPQGRPNAGQYWHSDLTYEEVPSKGSVMYAMEVPDAGGDTLFAHTAASYDALSEPMKAFLSDKTAIHDFRHAYETFSKRIPGTMPISEEVFAARPPVEHPVIRIHPETQRQCLFVNPGFTVRIKELSYDESDAILGYLYGHMVKPQFFYRHNWRANDLVLWDNRSLMHCAVGDYGPEKTRHMHRTTIMDSDAKK